MEGLKISNSKIQQIEQRCLQAAIDLHQRGLPIIVCQDKSPMHTCPCNIHWYEKIYTEDMIREEFAQEPRNNRYRNVGLILGPRSGIIDFECDCQHAELVFQELFHGEDINTPTYQSRRGKHRLFQYTPQMKEIAEKRRVCYNNWVGFYFQFGDIGGGTGLEIRIGGGKHGTLSLMPPSYTGIGEGGMARKWIISFDEVNPLPIPQSVMERLTPKHINYLDKYEQQLTHALALNNMKRCKVLMN